MRGCVCVCFFVCVCVCVCVCLCVCVCVRQGGKDGVMGVAAVVREGVCVARDEQVLWSYGQLQ